ncbi:efflux RND transporter periplasmic adaptor subunit [Parvibium lacunae]|uniref:Efflux RND transporter periplasmic adaptor subunit n=1 Tax=Parvibium lacunae TaxID=1888893 RepID=A0A368L859_9BURK|nr:efflux RND transporter periplasmic adaptor subunit [Parvibium lacunae]RCS59816.1 efflux RND transporter periplasmic adaptor subunit [Parvibium lacunae]
MLTFFVPIRIGLPPYSSAVTQGHRASRAGTGARFIGYSLIGMLLLGSLVGCDRAVPPPPADRPVRTLILGQQTQGGSNPVATEMAGELRPRLESRLGFRVGGKLAKRLVEAGQAVKPGQVVAELDSQDLKLALQTAQAQARSAQSERQLAQADLQRYTELRDQNFISQAEWQRRKTTFDLAHERDLQAQAQLQQQQNQLAYATLRSDVAGVVTAIDAEPGQVVAAGQSIVRVGVNRAESALDVHIAVPEQQLSRWSVGQGVEVALADSEVKSGWYPGKVRELAALADPASRTFTVKIAVTSAPEEWRWGMSARVRHGEIAPRATEWVVPLSAIVKDSENRATVFIYDSAKHQVKAKQVGVVGWRGNAAALAAGELAAGTEIVIAGAHLLRDGQVVKRLSSVPK